MENNLRFWQEKDFHIEEIDVSDAKRLSDLAFKSYRQHYTHLWDDKGEWYAERCFNPDRLAKELAHPNARFFIAANETEDLGYLKINLKYPLSIAAYSEQIFEDVAFFSDKEDCENALELERIYLTTAGQYKGIGQRLTRLSFDYARSLGRDIVWLKVMDSNESGIQFYEKMGFEKCGTMRLNFPKMKPILRGMFTMKKLIYG